MSNQPAGASLSAAEQEQFRVWNNTHQPFVTNMRIHQLVSRAASSAPEVVALGDGVSVITYKELEERSNRLAHYLRGQGVGRDVLVAVCFERGALMAVAALAILKAGGAYLPVDASYPAERMAFMLEDAKPQVVLTQSRLAQR